MLINFKFLLILWLLAMNSEMAYAENSQTREKMQKWISRGLAEAEENNLSIAADAMDRANKLGRNPIARLLAAIVETRQLHPEAAYAYAKEAVQSNPYPGFSEQTRAILKWALPSVLVTNNRCQYRPKDLLTQCEIAEPGRLACWLEQ